MRWTLLALLALCLVACLAPAQAGPVHRLYDSLSPGPACFAATIPVTGEPTCVHTERLVPSWPDELCFASTTPVTGHPTCLHPDA